jgi:uncharacterized protein YbjT (DUF2867 family)
MQKILVVGGTGRLGQPVARHLKDAGFQVQVMSRDVERAQKLFDESFEVVQADVTDVTSLERALDGCQGVHISVMGDDELRSVENIVALVPRLELQRITYISGATVCEQNSWFPMVKQKFEAEKAIRGCGVPYTIFCPTWPMEMLIGFARGGQPFLIGKQPYPIHWFAVDDLGRMVATAYQREEVANQRFFIHGPEGIPMKEAIERYCRSLHPDGKPVSVMPIWMAKLIGVITGNALLKSAAAMMAYFDKIGEMGDPAEANRILGAPAITLDAWLERRKAAMIQQGEAP